MTIKLSGELVKPCGVVIIFVFIPNDISAASEAEESDMRRFINHTVKDENSAVRQEYTHRDIKKKEEKTE